jgi:Ca2+-binding EF-hand superfamily protein
METQDMTYGNAGLLVTLGALLLSTTASANEIDDKFRLYDTNQDGAISLSEHAAAITSRFKQADTNHDGSLTADELFVDMVEQSRKAHGSAAMSGGASAGAKVVAETFLKAIDTDGNGRVSPTEYKVQGDRGFARGDTNGDQRMTLEEMQAGARPSGR